MSGKLTVEIYGNEYAVMQDGKPVALFESIARAMAESGQNDEIRDLKQRVKKLEEAVGLLRAALRLQESQEG